MMVRSIGNTKIHVLIEVYYLFDISLLPNKTRSFFIKTKLINCVFHIPIIKNKFMNLDTYYYIRNELREDFKI